MTVPAMLTGVERPMRRWPSFPSSPATDLPVACCVPSAVSRVFCEGRKAAGCNRLLLLLYKVTLDKGALAIDTVVLLQGRMAASCHCSE